MTDDPRPHPSHGRPPFDDGAAGRPVAGRGYGDGPGFAAGPGSTDNYTYGYGPDSPVGDYAYAQGVQRPPAEPMVDRSAFFPELAGPAGPEGDGPAVIPYGQAVERGTYAYDRASERGTPWDGYARGPAYRVADGLAAGEGSPEDDFASDRGDFDHGSDYGAFPVDGHAAPYGYGQPGAHRNTGADAGAPTEFLPASLGAVPGVNGDVPGPGGSSGSHPGGVFAPGVGGVFAPGVGGAFGAEGGFRPDAGTGFGPAPDDAFGSVPNGAFAPEARTGLGSAADDGAFGPDAPAGYGPGPDGDFGARTHSAYGFDGADRQAEAFGPDAEENFAYGREGFAAQPGDVYGGGGDVAFGSRPGDVYGREGFGSQPGDVYGREGDASYRPAPGDIYGHEGDAGFGSGPGVSFGPAGGSAGAAFGGAPAGGFGLRAGDGFDGQHDGGEGLIDLSTSRPAPVTHRGQRRRHAAVLAVAAAGVMIAGGAGYALFGPTDHPAVAEPVTATSATPTAEPEATFETLPDRSGDPVVTASTGPTPDTADPADGTGEEATLAPILPPAPTRTATRPPAAPTTSPAATRTATPAPSPPATRPVDPASPVPPGAPNPALTPPAPTPTTTSPSRDEEDE